MGVQEPLLSVIVPVYGTEKVLPRCLDSILGSSYQKLEVIVVDDKSPGNVEDVMEDYCQQDSRVKLVHHEVNKGLYRARITGVEHSHGDYIAFLDSDDHVSCDLYRRLIEKALVTDSDMVMGEFYMEENGVYSYFNFSHTRLMDIDAKGQEIRELLGKQAGLDFSLHVVWNKIYRKDLWEQCYPYLQLQRQHLIMCEDVLFSSVFYYFSQHMTNIHGDFVYYVQSEDSSIGLSSSVKKYRKNIADIHLVFDVLRKIFLESLRDKDYYQYLMKWYLLLVKIWVGNVERANVSFWRKKELYRLLQIDDQIITEKTKSTDDFFYIARTESTEIKQEQLKKKILDPTVQVISFDIFDTLLSRPFWQPTDLFYLLDNDVNKMLDTTDFIDFKQIRIEAEKIAREKSHLLHPMWEEITLDDIYDQLQEMLDLSPETRQKIQQKEIALELQYCHPRHYAQELFNLALYLKKKVIITSDMYLPLDVISRLLEKNGYKGYEHIYLSSEVKLAKWTGHLYEYAAKKEQVSPQQILHIGDNLDSDVKMAQQQGLRALHFPKATALLENSLPGFYGGEGMQNIYIHPFMQRDARQFERFYGLRTMLGVVANKLYDNPYTIINPTSDFNGSPATIGYFALGMQLFAVAHWLMKAVRENQYDHLNFMARDGYLPMEAYKILSQIYPTKCQTHYVRLTRSSILPLQFSHTADVFGLVHNINIFAQSPKSIFSVLQMLLKQDVQENGKEICEKAGFLYEAPFSSLTSWYQFAHFLKGNWLDLSKLPRYKEQLDSYLRPMFSGKTATFDIGYSCRIESALKKNFNFDITPYYIHVNNDIPFRRERKNQIHIHNFYSYTPGVTGIVRELFISKMEPSCKSLQFASQGVQPIFKEYHLPYTQKYVIGLIQQNALQFVQDMADLFGKDLDELDYQREDAGLVSEYYQAQAKFFDRLPFAAIPFEDDIGIGTTVNTLDYWNGQIANTNAGINLEMDSSLRWMTPMWKRVLCMYFIDRNMLKKKVKKRWQNAPLRLKLLISTYRKLRWVYRRGKRR